MTKKKAAPGGVGTVARKASAGAVAKPTRRTVVVFRFEDGSEHALPIEQLVDLTRTQTDQSSRINEHARIAEMARAKNRSNAIDGAPKIQEANRERGNSTRKAVADAWESLPTVQRGSGAASVIAKRVNRTSQTVRLHLKALGISKYED